MQRRNASTDRKWPSRILLKERARNIARDMLCTLGRKTKRAYVFFGESEYWDQRSFFVSVYSTLAGKFR